MKDGEHFRFGEDDETSVDGFCLNDHDSVPQIYVQIFFQRTAASWYNSWLPLSISGGNVLRSANIGYLRAEYLEGQRGGRL